MKYVTIISTYFLAAVFLFTGIDKLFHYKGFITALSSYVVIPDGSAEYLALPIILSEIWIALGLLITSWRKMAALTAVGAMALFTTALTINYIYAPKSICGCWFSVTLGTATLTHIIMNLTLVGVAFAIWADIRAMNNRTALSSEISNIRLDARTEPEIGSAV